MIEVTDGDDGVVRCSWGNGSSDYASYHDNEWGRPVDDDRTLFEKLTLEGFQAGLAWITILRKREAFREAFRIRDEDDWEDINDEFHKYVREHIMTKMKASDYAYTPPARGSVGGSDDK